MILQFTKLKIRNDLKAALKIPVGNEAIYTEIYYLTGFCTALMYEDKITISTKSRYCRLFLKIATGMISLK